MPMLNLISDFGLIRELTSRLNSEAFTLNHRLGERYNIQTLADYRKVKATFKELKRAMDDLDRSVMKISHEIPDSPPNYGTDPTT